jgi:DNA-binding MarR family transcriptional regulator
MLSPHEKLRKLFRLVHPKTHRRNNSRTVALLLEISLQPGLSVEELSTVIRLHKSGCGHNLNLLSQAGLVDLQKQVKGGRLRVFPITTESGEKLLQKLTAIIAA